MRSLVQWLDDKGFYARDVWDIPSGKMVKNQKLQLFPHQRDILQHVFTPDENGNFPYTEVVYSCPKKCLSPLTRVLTADLRWVEVGSLSLGDRLLAFDENPVGVYKRNKEAGGSNRRYRVALVTDNGREVMKCRKLIFDDGTVITASLNHKWLTKKRGGKNLHWIETSKLRVGDTLDKFLYTWEDPKTYDDGYVAGCLDGEGHVRPDGREIGIGQRENELLSEFIRIIDELGYPHSRNLQFSSAPEYFGHYVQKVAFLGGRAKVLEVLGHFRPKRLLAKILPRLDGEIGQIWVQESHVIVDIVDVVSEVVTLGTTTETFFAEGYASHNSGKTLIEACILAWAFEEASEGSEVYVVANDLEQAAARAFTDLEYHTIKQFGISSGRNRITSENGTFVQAIAQHYASAAGARPFLSVFDELWAYLCSSSDTQALSRNGWKSYDQLTVGEEIATWKDGKFVWSPVEAINIYDYSGEMVRLKHRRSSMLMTPNHRVLGKFRYTGPEKLHANGWEFKTASELFSVYEGEVPVIAEWDGTTVERISIPECKTRKFGSRAEYTIWPEKFLDPSDWMEFFGYYLAEGSVIYTQKNGPACAVFVAQSSTASHQTYVKIGRCLDRLGFAYSANKDGFRIKSPQLGAFLDRFGKSSSKYVPVEYKDFSPVLLWKLLQAYLDGDGWVAGKGFQFHTTSKQLADDVAEIGLKCGFIPRIMSLKKHGPNRNPIYRGSLSLGYITYDKRNLSMEQYDGIVWCPTTKHGTWLARKDGFIYWTGNSERSRRMWAEMTPPPSVENALRVTVTYAGYENESDQLLELYNLCFKEEAGKYISGEVIPELAHIVDGYNRPVCRRNGRTFVYWDTVPRMPWQTSEYYCLPLPKDKEKLQVLTSCGWKPAEDIGVSDALCTRSSDGFIEYQNPLNIFRSTYSGNLLRLKHTKCDLLMTPNHRVLAAFASHTRKVKEILGRGFFEYEYKTAEEASKIALGWIPGQGYWNHTPTTEFVVEDLVFDGDTFVRFMGWYLSEGNVFYTRVPKNKLELKRYPVGVMISQDQVVNADKYSEILGVCKSLGLNVSCRSSGVIVWGAKLARYVEQFGKSSDKYIPRWILNECSKEQLSEFLRAYLLGDGTKRVDGDGYLVYTNSDQMKMDLMELAFKVGYRPRYLGSFSSAPEKGRKPIHHISLSTSHIGWSQGNKRHNWSVEVAPDGCEVWCPTLPNGNFYVMQNGVCYWTGNSQQLQTLRPADFLRMHKNRWVSSSETFVPIELYDKCVNGSLSPFTITPDHPFRHFPIALGVDIGLKHDTMALVGSYYDFSRKVCGIAFHRVFIPPPGALLDIEATAETFIREVCRRFNVFAVLYDPYQFQRSAVTLIKAGLPLIEYNQSVSNMIAATSAFYELLRSRKLEVYQDDELRDHVRYASVEISTRGARLVKGKHAKYPIDAAVAMAMSCYWSVKYGGVDASQPIRIMNPFSDSEVIPSVRAEEMALPPELRSYSYE